MNLPRKTRTIARLRWFEDRPAFNEGLGWYVDAQQAVIMLARWAGLPIETTSNVLAVLSPRTTVRGNVRMFCNVVRGLPSGGLAGNETKARALLAGGEPSDYVRGPKVQAFAQALLGVDALVLDTWAFHAAIGKDQPTSQREYDRVHEAYVKRSRALELPVSAYQAGIWTAVRRAAGYSRNESFLDTTIQYLLEIDNV